jgi:hypothetical protein
MLTIDMSAVKIPGKAKQNNLPPECEQPINAGGVATSMVDIASLRLVEHKLPHPLLVYPVNSTDILRIAVIM